MLYREFDITPPLSEYIQVLWAMESETPEDNYPRSQILPDGIVEVIFHYEDPFYTWQDGEQCLQPVHFAISMMRKFVEIGSSGKTGFISVRFFPWGAYHFFDKPISSFLDTTIEGHKLWGEDSATVINDVKNAADLDERVKVVEEFLIKQLRQHRKYDSKIDEAVKLIRSTKGMLSIEEICAKSGFSKKQLERKFESSVGAMPKIFSRITRFLYICQHLDEQRNKSLTALTHECGFYDQAHFIKEFKAFSDFTPKEFFAKNNVYFSDI
jgi:AraC-like DNA-binding protein